LKFDHIAYVQLILNDVVKLRNQHNTIEKAMVYAKSVLPTEPRSLVEQYLEGKERPTKESVVANIRSRFSTPALPVSNERGSGQKHCVCKGKCATRKCDCRAADVICDSKCKCSIEKCKNRE
jgi:hypothetical protein